MGVFDTKHSFKPGFPLNGFGNPCNAIKYCIVPYLLDFKTKFRCLHFRFQFHIQVCVKSAQGLHYGMTCH